MSKRKKIFWVCVVWFLICIPIGSFWSSAPYMWAINQCPGEDGQGAGPEEVQKRFPIHLAPLPTPKLLQHADQIASDEPEEPPKTFNALEWGVRETSYRAILCFSFWMLSGFYMNWFLGMIIRGRETWEG